ncbi:MAG: hypothetical protein NC094_08240 [Bacteroidales bacterium]|nr:hypothetical protein [Lachnoclostridium sp.]MCM1383116.1 hypothetical protein [Lachnoclostridium sp.]MCM1465392.1 hypothetical protein [Bacteroidales bacterium]
MINYKAKKIAAFLMAAFLFAGCFPEKAYASEENFAIPAEVKESLSEIVEERPVMALVYLAAEYPVRAEASYDSEELVSVPSGQTVFIQDVSVSVSEEGYEVWEYVNLYYRDQEYSGYIPRHYLACSDQRFLTWEAEYGMNPEAAVNYAAEDGTVRVNYSDVEQFPASYQEKLRQLKELHPQWVFVPMETGLDWNEVIANEITGSKSLIYYTYGDWMKEGLYDQHNWYFASEDALKYFMDPRNWLTEDNIFQFELLTYNEEYHTEAAVEAFLNNTFMNSSSNAPGTDMTYAHIIWAVGAEDIRQVSPFHLAARIYQEQGQGTSPLISGTYPGYEGYYNYFNVGATGTTNQAVVESGLNYAKNQNWNSAYYSILGGANVISANYIRKGQDTLYLQKFNVNPAAQNPLYTHQYMQNISAPSGEGKSVRNLYRQANSLEGSFVFKIPVYRNMPENACAQPTYSTNVVLQIPAGYSSEVYLDGVAYPSAARNGRYIITAKDGSAKSAVVYQYDGSGVPTGMYVWTLTYQNNAYTATPQPEMENLLGYHGFSIRITGKSGIRFKSSISQELRSRLTEQGGVNGYTLKEYGTLVMNNANRSTYPMIKDGQKVAGGLSYGVNDNGVLEDKVYETVSGRYRFTSVLVGLPASQYRTEFAFRGYAVLEKDGAETVIYGPIVARSIYSLAEQVLNMGLYQEGSDADRFIRQLIADG